MTSAYLLSCNLFGKFRTHFVNEIEVRRLENVIKNTRRERKVMIK